MKLKNVPCLRMSLALLLLAGVFAAAQTEAQVKDVELLARQVERELIAPCCWSQTVAEHRSEASEKMRREIRDMIRKGMSHQQILDFYIARHGERILAAPRPRGFNLAAYVLPGAGLVAGAGVVILLLRRWRPAPSSAPPPTERADPAYLERVERELKEKE